MEFAAKLYGVILIYFFLLYLAYRKLDLSKEPLRKRMKFYSQYKRPLVEEKLKEKTLEEYVKYEKYEKSKIATWAYSLFTSLKRDLDEEEIDNFEHSVMFYWDCKERPWEYSKEVVKLWERFFELFFKYKTLQNITSILSVLTRLTSEAKIEIELKNKLDSRIIELFKERFDDQLIKYDFRKVLEEVVEWYTFKGDYYYPFLGIGTTETELHHLETLYNNFDSEFQDLPTLSK